MAALFCVWYEGNEIEQSIANVLDISLDLRINLTNEVSENLRSKNLPGSRSSEMIKNCRDDFD